MNLSCEGRCKLATNAPMQINELLKLSEFFLSDNGGRPMGNIRINPAVRPDAKVLAQMLDRLNQFCGREHVWFHYTVSGWITFRWVGGSEKFHRSLARRCRPSNLTHQLQETQRILASYAEPPKPLAERSTEELRELARAAISRMDRSTLLKMFGQPQAEGTPESSQPERPEQPEQPEAIASKPLDKMTVKELKQVAKTRGLKGYSRLRKAELLASLQGSEASPQPQTTPIPTRITRDTLSALTIRQLQNFAKGKGIKDYWRLRKDNLVEKLLTWDFNRRFDEQLPIARNTLNPYRHAA